MANRQKPTASSKPNGERRTRSNNGNNSGRDKSRYEPRPKSPLIEAYLADIERQKAEAEQARAKELSMTKPNGNSRPRKSRMSKSQAKRAAAQGTGSNASEARVQTA